MKRRDLVEFLEHVPAFPSPSYELEQYKTSAALAADVLCAISAQFGGLEGCCVADLGCGTGMLSLGCLALGASFVLGLDVDGAALACAAEAAEELGVSESLDLVLADIGAIGAALDAQGNASPIVLSALQEAAAAVPPAAATAAAAAGHSLESPGSAAECEGGAQEGAPSPDAAAASAASAAALRAMLTRWGGRFDTVVMNPPFGTRLPGVDVAFLKVALALVRPGGCVYSLHKSSTRGHLLKCAAAWGAAGQAVAQLRFPIPATYAFHREEQLDVAVDLLRLQRGGGGEGGGSTAGAGAAAVAVEVGGGGAGGGRGSRGSRGGRGSRGSRGGKSSRG